MRSDVKGTQGNMGTSLSGDVYHLRGELGEGRLNDSNQTLVGHTFYANHPKMALYTLSYSIRLKARHCSFFSSKE